MGQILHDCATTTHAVRKAIQRSKASVATLAERYGINQKTVRKWRARKSVEDRPMGPKEVRSTVLSQEEEAACVAFRNLEPRKAVGFSCRGTAGRMAHVFMLGDTPAAIEVINDGFVIDLGAWRIRAKSVLNVRVEESDDLDKGTAQNN